LALCEPLPASQVREEAKAFSPRSRRQREKSKKRMGPILH
jgi:hypothetical protein